MLMDHTILVQALQQTYQFYGRVPQLSYKAYLFSLVPSLPQVFNAWNIEKLREAVLGMRTRDMHVQTPHTWVWWLPELMLNLALHSSSLPVRLMLNSCGPWLVPSQFWESTPSQQS